MGLLFYIAWSCLISFVLLANDEKTFEALNFHMNQFIYYILTPLSLRQIDCHNSIMLTSVCVYIYVSKYAMLVK